MTERKKQREIYALGKHLHFNFLKAHYVFIKACNSFKLTMQQCIIKCTPDVPAAAPITESPPLACQGDGKKCVFSFNN